MPNWPGCGDTIENLSSAEILEVERQVCALRARKRVFARRLLLSCVLFEETEHLYRNRDQTVHKIALDKAEKGEQTGTQFCSRQTRALTSQWQTVHETAQNKAKKGEQKSAQVCSKLRIG